LGGVSQLLFKPPKAAKPNERPENKPSFLFDEPVNTIAQGQCVPVG
jgi:predicted phage tail protein